MVLTLQTKINNGNQRQLMNLTEFQLSSIQITQYKNTEHNADGVIVIRERKI